MASKPASDNNARWKDELSLAERELRKFWERGKRVIKRFLGETHESAVAPGDKYNVFWANVQVLKAALYANPAKPVVKREFDDHNDQIGRTAAVIMERMLFREMEKPTCDMHVGFQQCVEDRLVPGLGQLWFRYEPEIATRNVEGIGEFEELVNEFVRTDYVYWEDFWWSPARTWAEVRWVSRRVWMTKTEFEARFGNKYKDLVSWSKKPPVKYGERVTPEEGWGVEKTEIFEIWEKKSKKVHWVSRSCDHILDSKPDPLKLSDFWPCPTPLRGTTTTSTTIPKADYLMVQSQYARLDNLTTRIGLLEDAIQASGVYDKTNAEISQFLPASGQNKMIPVENWAVFSEKNGLKGVVDWFPLEMIVNALDKLRELKQEAKAELYELTGLSDIMRGVTNPRETATAQGLKAQYSSTRLQFLQGEVALFVQEGYRIKAEIIALHFKPETIYTQSLIELTPDVEYAQEAIALIKDKWKRIFRIQVFADTLAIPDYNAERTGRTEFITAMGQFLAQAFPMLEAQPATAPFMLQILQWGIASFRSAQSIEGVFAKAVAEVTKSLQAPKPPPPPDPALLKAQAEIQNMAKEVELRMKEAAGQLQMDKEKNQADVEAVFAKAQADVTTMMAKANAAIQISREKAAVDIQIAQAKERKSK